MDNVYWDSESESVFWNDNLNPINPETNRPWTNESEALAWIDALPEPSAPIVPTLIAAAVRTANGNEDDGSVEIQEPYKLVTLTEGDIVEIDIRVEDGSGNLLPVPDNVFTLPIIGLYGSPMKVVDVAVVDSVAKVTTKFPIQGMWEVTSEQANMHIEDQSQHFAFSGLQFKVKEDLTLV